MNVRQSLFHRTIRAALRGSSDLRFLRKEAIIEGQPPTRRRWQMASCSSSYRPLSSHLFAAASFAITKESIRGVIVAHLATLPKDIGFMFRGLVTLFRSFSVGAALSVGVMFTLAILMIPDAGLSAETNASAEAVTSTSHGKIDFSRDIRPLLSDNCYACHGPAEAYREADLRLDMKESAFGELDSGERALVPGDLEASQLYQRLISQDEDERMPPVDHAKSLSAEEIELFKQWIEQGAKWQGHWSYITPEQSTLPELSKNKAWARADLDTFVAARLEEEGLQPVAAADKVTLIRRVTLDLTGLPPTMADVEAFLADKSNGAYERLVDRLLASSRYGEHMARFWLDAARYADTHGLHIDNRRAIWPYRDWVVGAFNKNMPFDQFTIEQLAGDLLEEPTRDQLIATGFIRAHVTTNEGGVIREEFYVRNTIDRVETTATIWMGLTAGCAVCHDHKFDPLTKKEFYQLFAFFNSTAENVLDGNRSYYPPMLHLTTPEQDEQLAVANKQLTSLKEEINAEEARLEEEAEKKAAAAAQENDSESSDQETPTDDAEKKEAAKKADAPLESPKLNSLKEQLAKAREQKNAIDAKVPVTMIAKEIDEPRQAYDLERGEYDKKGDKVPRDVPAFLPPMETSDRPADRLSLARWLVDPKHPLTARVTVNRIWQQLFGVGIVKTSEDFGAQGEWPSHPKLLDWLARDFVDSGWDVKRLMKQIVMSATYQQTSKVGKERYVRDPENRLLSRGPRFRMDAETVRDNALAISGLLVDSMGGEGVRPYQPDGIWFAVAYTASDTAHFKQDTDDGLYRRSLYTFWKRTAPPPAMMAFDAPSRETCRVRRDRTNTPLAALVLLNDTQYVEAARNLAQKMMTEGGSNDLDRVTYGVRRAIARSPKQGEIEVLLRVYRQQLAEFEQNEQAARDLVAVGESPVDESLNVQQLAAWTMVANLLLNLDETITKG